MPVVQIPKPEQFYGITALLNKPLDPSEGLVVQFETSYPKGYGASCQQCICRARQKRSVFRSVNPCFGLLHYRVRWLIHQAPHALRRLQAQGFGGLDSLLGHVWTRQMRWFQQGTDTLDPAPPEPSHRRDHREAPEAQPDARD